MEPKNNINHNIDFFSHNCEFISHSVISNPTKCYLVAETSSHSKLPQKVKSNINLQKANKKIKLQLLYFTYYLFMFCQKEG